MAVGRGLTPRPVAENHLCSPQVHTEAEAVEPQQLQEAHAGCSHRGGTERGQGQNLGLPSCLLDPRTGRTRALTHPQHQGSPGKPAPTSFTELSGSSAPEVIMSQKFHICKKCGCENEGSHVINRVCNLIHSPKTKGSGIGFIVNKTPPQQLSAQSLCRVYNALQQQEPESDLQMVLREKCTQRVFPQQSLKKSCTPDCLLNHDFTLH